MELPWVLQKLEENKTTPQKIPAVPIVTAELPDEEDEDDQEYDPVKDLAEMSDEDSVATASDAGSQTPQMFGSPGGSSQASLSTPRISEIGEASMFKHPSGGSKSRPSQSPRPGQSGLSSSRAIKSLNFEETPEEKAEVRKNKSC